MLRAKMLSYDTESFQTQLLAADVSTSEVGKEDRLKWIPSFP